MEVKHHRLKEMRNEVRYCEMHAGIMHRKHSSKHVISTSGLLFVTLVIRCKWLDLSERTLDLHVIIYAYRTVLKNGFAPLDLYWQG